MITQRTLMRRTAAAFVVYHGTATGRDSRILESILANGLVQDQEDRPYGGIGEDDWEPDANTSFVLQLDESFEGVYLTNSFGEAERYAKNAVLHYGGDRLYVVARIDTSQGAWIDEDLLFGEVNDYVRRAVYPDLNSYEQYYAVDETDWAAVTIDYLDHTFGIETLTPEVREVAPTLGAAMKHFFIAFLLHHFDREMYEEAEEADDEEFDIFESPDEHLGDYHGHADEAIEALSELALPRGDKHNVRVPAVPYEGPTRILAVLSQDRDTNDYTVWYEAPGVAATRYLP